MVKEENTLINIAICDDDLVFASKMFRWFWVAVLGISAISATFSLAFSGCFAGFG